MRCYSGILVCLFLLSCAENEYSSVPESIQDEDTCASDKDGAQDCEEGPDLPPDSYRFLMVRDVTAPEDVWRNYPGVDLDSITLEKADGTVFHPSKVEDFYIVMGDTAIDPQAVLGPPDDGCSIDPTKLVSLGGYGGYVVVSFETEGFDGRIENGDAIVIHEIGRASCPDSYDDEPFHVTISMTLVDAQNGTSFLLSTEARGEDTIAVTGL